MNGPVVRLKDLCSLITKGTTPTSIGFDFSDEGVGFLRVQNVSGGRVNFQNGTLFIEESVHQELRRSQILPGDILLSIAGTIGRTGVVPAHAPALNCNQALAIIRPEDKVFRPFLRHWLESDNAKSQMRGATVTGTIQNLSLAQVGGLQVPLPPLPEQRRIAAILDQADALRAKRREALAQLDSLTQSIFIEMFGDPVTNSLGWKIVQLDAVANFFGGNSLPEGVPFINQQDGYFLMKVSDMNLEGNEKSIERCQSWSSVSGSRSGTCPAGSIVIPKRGGAIGTNKKRVTTRETVLDPNLMAISPKLVVVEREYLFQWFQRFDLSSIASGSSVPQLNKQDLIPLKIQVPPLPIQKLFVNRIEAVETIKASNVSALRELDTLFATLQHRAFQGEL